MRTLCIALFLILAGSVGFAQADKNCCSFNPFPKTIKVTGSAAMEVTPDELFVEVYLREYKKKGEEKTSLNKIKSDFLTLCKNTNIPDSNIVVSDYEGANNYFYYRRNRKQNPDLYAAIRYVVKFSDMAKVNAFADGLDDEAVQTFGIKVSHSKIIEFRRQLKISAVKAAKEKATYLTEAINEKLGEAITIEEPSDLDTDKNDNNRLLANNFNLSLKESKTVGYDEMVSTVNYKKIKLRFEVEILFALK